MNINDEDLIKILLDQNYISKEDIKTLKEVPKKEHISIIEYLISNDIITKPLLGEAFAEYYNTTFFNLNSKPPTSEMILKIPEALARKYRIVLVNETDKEVWIATSNFEKTNNIAAKVQEFFPKSKIKLLYAFDEEIETAFNNYKKSLQTRFSKIIESEERVAPEIINEIITDAAELAASDIHCEPTETEVMIRFRIDGILHEVGVIPKELFENILNRIKVQAGLRLDEHFSSQDGAIRTHIDGVALDLRVSIVPTINGQNLVMRILSQYIRKLALSDLGLSKIDEGLLEISYKKTFGMILTTGPTGSGKTTTLYSVVKKLQSPNVNITTIEDPVEYKIPGINQIQVNKQTDMTFAQGLRSIVRQDPNIVLVGEIRDRETAEIAVNAALTGHLLLSTFHANDAATAIPRLIDMGVEPFLLASTLNLIIAQRLIRRICRNCRYSSLVTHKQLEEFIPDPKKYFSEDPATVYAGKGCNICNGTGYKGRISIFELIYVSAEIQKLIVTNPSADAIRELAIKQGAHTFFEDGIEKVKEGITTIEELTRVAPLTIDTLSMYGRNKSK